MIGPADNSGGSRKKELRSQIELLDAQLGRKRIPEVSQACDLFYDAMEAATVEEEIEMLGRAIELDPAHTDAHLAMLKYMDLPLDQEIEILTRVVKLAEKRLGENAFQEMHGQFWGFHETRPYMRARFQLADCLHSAGRSTEAFDEWEGILDLNPNDNQGVRYELLAAYLENGNLDGAERLFDTYDEVEWNVVFAWGKALWLHLKGKDPEADSAIVQAEKQNPHIKPFLLGKKRLPKTLPPYYSHGSKEEAACFAHSLTQAWKAHKSARAWLKDQG